jgi:hypothetical protein
VGICGHDYAPFFGVSEGGGRSWVVEIRKNGGYFGDVGRGGCGGVVEAGGMVYQELWFCGFGKRFMRG